jgi:enterochelin esterase-like enzyme
VDPASPGPNSAPSTGPRATPTASPARPWLTWLPSGAGSVTAVDLPAPWIGGTATTDGVTIYAPPGYKTSDNRRYPVLYEAPKPFSDWETAVHISTVLDSLIDGGDIPPMFVVFVADIGGPYPDTECANSVDGRQWMDTFIGETVVSYVDAHYRTIATPAGRAITGFSQGGYCAAIVALRHPTVFGTSIPISGYFQAGKGDAGSALPFGGDAAALDAASPSTVAAKLPADVRARLYFIVVASPTQPVYGEDSANFERLLADQGYPFVAVQAKVPHGWVQVRQEFPGALQTWAARLVATGAL